MVPLSIGQSLEKKVVNGKLHLIIALWKLRKQANATSGEDHSSVVLQPYCVARVEAGHSQGFRERGHLVRRLVA